MLRTPMILGLSMVRRKNRRWFVGLTYAAVFAFIFVAAVIRAWPWATNHVAWLLLVCGVVSRLVFGRVVKQTLYTRRWGETINLGLAPAPPRDDDKLDERELAVRNAAYFEAYRVLALYCFLFVPVLLKGSIWASILPLVAMPLLVLALTLPQAVVLWTEPDVPEEARV